jgi:hypothetical protein
MFALDETETTRVNRPYARARFLFFTHLLETVGLAVANEPELRFWLSAQHDQRYRPPRRVGLC